MLSFPVIGMLVGLVILWVVGVAGLLTLASCQLTTFVPKKEVKTRVFTRTVTIDSTRLEFIDTTFCPPDLTDTLLVTKTITRVIPPRDIIITDTVLDTVMRENVLTRVAEKVVTKNNWWLLLLGLIIGYYGKGLIGDQSGDK